jgi:hypothetical protein
MNKDTHMKDKALKLALEALQKEEAKYRDYKYNDGAPEYVYNAIAAIKQSFDVSELHKTFAKLKKEK